MGVLYVCIAIAGAIAVWPVNRWIARNNCETPVYGFWVSLGTGLIAGALSLLTGQSPLKPWVFGPGVVTGVAFAIGFCVIIMH